MRSTLILLVLLALAGCQRRSATDFRLPGARADSTIFTALDLPAPNDQHAASGAPGPEYWQQRADYVIDVSLDPETRIVKGRETITYENHSPQTLEYLWLHLEQNVHRDDSIRSRMNGFKPGGGITGLRVTHGGNELETAEYETLLRVIPPAPLAPGDKMSFDVEWQFWIPDQALRHGFDPVENGGVFQLAQWFPCMVKYDEVHGWNAIPYVGSGEFYTDFGNYEVNITVPRNHLVVATGVLQNESDVYTAEQQERLAQARKSADTVMIRSESEINDPHSRPVGAGHLTWRYEAENVRTFAWASSRGFILDAASLGDVLIQSAYPKEGRPLWDDSTQMLRTAIKGYNERWYEYPYPVATNVNGRAGGMEYPMIIFCRQRRSEAALYSVTTHEIGHNWFPMVVNSDERRHAWMDEGFNTFINYYSRPEWTGGEPRGRGSVQGIVSFMRTENQLPIDTPADYLARGLVSATQYSKTGAGLVLLRESILGPERFDFAFREYINRWAFKSPRPADFFRTMEDASGMDLAWFWRGWFYETGTLDQTVQQINQPADGERGTVVFTNEGELVMPLDWEIQFEGGEVRRGRVPVHAWASSSTHTLRVGGDAVIDRVIVDPDKMFPDVDRSDNELPRARYFKED